MTLEETDRIDITATKGNKMELVIIDAGLTTDPRERFDKLVDKLKTYVDYAASDEFKKKYPSIKAKNITIKVMCKNEPTGEMKGVSQSMLRGKAKNTIPVKYEKANYKSDYSKGGAIGGALAEAETALGYAKKGWEVEIDPLNL